MIHGKNLILSDSQTGFGHFAIAKSCDVTTDAYFLEVSSPTQGAWREYIQKQQSWSASTSHLLASFSAYKYFRSCQDNGTKLTIRFFDPEMQIFYRGYAYIKSLKLQGEVSSLAKMSVDLQTTGKLEAAEEHTINANEDYNEQGKIIFNSNGSITIVQNEQGEGGIYGKEIITTAARTRISMIGKGLVVEADYNDLITALTRYNSESINEWAVLINPTEGTKTVIVGPGTYQVIINHDDHAGSSNCGIYMSSF